jgi:hypothetical protein
VGEIGPAFLLGGAVGMDYQAASGWTLRPAIAWLLGPRERVDDGLILGRMLGIGLEAGFLWKQGVFRFGPMLHLELQRSWLELALGGEDGQSFDWWDFVYGGGLELMLSLSESVAIGLDVGIEGHSDREAFKRRSNSAIVVRTPWVSARASLGIRVGF